jgi:hypothetical protein
MLKTTFLTEFLTESNLILTQEDYGNKLYDLLSPVRNLLHKEKDVLTFSIARYCGADTRLAFFCEWYYQTFRLTIDGTDLLEENREYLRKRVPVRLKGIPNLYDLIDYDIKSLFLPQQITFMHNKSIALSNDVLKKNDYLAKFLSGNYFNRPVSGEVFSRKYLYTEDFNISQYLEAQTERLSFVMIAYPALLAFTYTFNQDDSPINPKKIKWVLLEEILKSIACLHQTGSNEDFYLFIYRSRLSEKEEFEWLQKSTKDQIQTVQNKSEVKEIAEKHRQRIYEKSKTDLKALVFPEKDKDMLSDLLDWAYNLKP